MIKVNQDALQFGVIASGLSAVIFVLGYYAGFNPFEGSSVFTLIFSLVVLFYGMHFIKKYQYNSNIDFLSAMKTALWMVIPYMIVYILSVGVMVTTNILDKLADRVRETQVEKVELKKVEIEEIAGLEAYKTALQEAENTELIFVFTTHVMLRAMWLSLFTIIASVYFRT